ncbi:hypothetical protein HMPREF0063_11916 [Aeromicrobium marinum DSM 15272]|uniref:Uncharacterized protein n=1 Tax=Aeromicrobium marinum DSM 15272 TaxID=585531 RepID=E2SDY0_9ACTN|nr:hypothetical protein [Aeromicrobium marinum]EFQ82707.1 hypothetical protein HMPREF0063_11916 [Aeromicrobium marinum DSM 15272]
MVFTYNIKDLNSVGQVRLLLNDVDEHAPVFQDEEIAAFLLMEGEQVKLAAAQAIDVNASNELLASKVLRTQDLQVDGAKVADAMRAHAKALRQQHFDALEGDGYFEVVEYDQYPWPELT